MMIYWSGDSTEVDHSGGHDDLHLHCEVGKLHEICMNTRLPFPDLEESSFQSNHSCYLALTEEDLAEA